MREGFFPLCPLERTEFYFLKLLLTRLALRLAFDSPGDLLVINYYTAAESLTEFMESNFLLILPGTGFLLLAFCEKMSIPSLIVMDSCRLNRVFSYLS